MGVAPEVTDDLLRAAEGGLGIDNPVLAKERSEKRREALSQIDRVSSNSVLLPLALPQPIFAYGISL